MKLAYPKHLDTTPIVVSFTDGITEDGDEKVISTYTGKCNFSGKTRYIRGTDGHQTILLGKAILCGDIAPELKKITGTVLVNDVSYKIYQAGRLNNPDGSVHHTELELM